MTTQLRVWPVALLAALIACSISDPVWAQRSGRAVVAARQQVQMSLAAAMADGRLTTMEQYSILQKGKRALAPHELQALKQTLIRLSEQEPTPSSPALPKRAGKNTQAQKNNRSPKKQTPGASPQRATQAKGIDRGEENEERAAETASYDEPVEPEDAGSPFKEEPLADSEILPTPEAELGPEYYDPMTDGPVMFDEGLGLLGGLQASRVYRWPDLRLSTSVEAFKGPLDLDNQNGNFGLQFAINAGLPLAQRLGIGFQAGTSGVLTDFHGTQFTGSTIRAQNFTTVGLFQHVPVGAQRVKWGFAFDWLHDDYYDTLQMSQWRVKLAYDLNDSNEIGLLACIPNDGDVATLGDGTGEEVLERFKPVAQGVFYYSHCWATGPKTTAWLGMAEEPGGVVFGGDGRVPLTCRWAFVGNVNYVLPSASGAWGQDEEMWNVSIGIEFTPGIGGNHCMAKKFSPMFPLANNGTFAIRRY